MKKTVVQKVIYILMTALLVVSCSDKTENVQVDTDPVIKQVRVTPNWNLAERDANYVEAEIYDPQGTADVKAVTVTIKNSTGTVLLTDSLFDDGAYFHPSDGDVIAGDGVFRNQFDAATDVDTSAGDYFIEINASDLDGNAAAEPGEAMVVFGYSYPVEFKNIQTPDTLKSGSDDRFFYVTLSHPKGIDAIKEVKFKLYNSTMTSILQESVMFNDGDFDKSGDVTAGDSVYSYRINKSFAAGRIGNYKILFESKDQFQKIEQSEAENIFLENEVGSIIQTSVPDQLQRPSSAILNVTVQDPQGLVDIDSVYFYSKKPDGTLAGNGMAFLMFDDGDYTNHGDTIAKDGIYSLRVQIGTSNAAGTYEFSFFMRDKVGHLTPATKELIEVQ